MKSSFMEKNLKNVEWGEFEIGKIFDVLRGKRLVAENRKRGNIPYYSASSSNNGLTDLISNSLFIESNCLLVTTFCDSFYVKGQFTASDEISILKNSSINQYSGKFISNIITSNKEKFAFGYKAFTERIKRQTILLPTTPQGEPDYNFMEEFMKEIEQRKLKKYQDYLVKRIDQVKDFKSVASIKEKEWAEFYLNEIFTDIQRGRRLKKDDHKKGRIPYISSTAMNNGVDGFVSNTENVRFFNNCLTIANSGSVGATFYQPFSFVASDHVTKLANENFNEFIYLFISNITKRVGEKYSFNREINDQRIKKEIILLPTNNQGKPDYEYMENYIKKIEYDKLTKYLNLKLKF
jgi:hypothetical protein